MARFTYVRHVDNVREGFVDNQSQIELRLDVWQTRIQIRSSSDTIRDDRSIQEYASVTIIIYIQ